VRNAAAAVVQLRYGDDGMDPVVMEGAGGMPLDFERLLAKVSGCGAAVCVRVCVYA
jgi:DNA-directed RNA polymerase III subunit RPC1